MRPSVAGQLGRSVKAAALELCADVSVFVSVGRVLPCVVLRVTAKDDSCRVRINTGDFALLRFGALRCGVVRKAFSGRRSTNELPRQWNNLNILERAVHRVKSARSCSLYV